MIYIILSIILTQIISTIGLYFVFKELNRLQNENILYLEYIVSIQKELREEN